MYGTSPADISYPKICFNWSWIWTWSRAI